MAELEEEDRRIRGDLWNGDDGGDGRRESSAARAGILTPPLGVFGRYP